MRDRMAMRQCKSEKVNSGVGTGDKGCEERGSAKVQIGAELLSKSAKVDSGVGLGVGVGNTFRSRVSAVGCQVQVFRFGYRFGL